jgi:hypothetical protein
MYAAQHAKPHRQTAAQCLLALWIELCQKMPACINIKKNGSTQNNGAEHPGGSTGMAATVAADASSKQQTVCGKTLQSIIT